jgi:octaprenyl-diphosphate synthase
MPTAHMVFGKNSAILSGDVLLATTMLITTRYRNFELVRCVADAAIKIAAGEVVEIANLRNSDLAFADYLRIVEGKTAWLTGCSCEVGAILAGAAPELVKAAAVYGFELGLAFQMVDDAIDLLPEKHTGKPTGGDIREGKITPPLYFYLEGLTADKRNEFLGKFSSGAFTGDDITRIVQDLLAHKCDQRTRDLAEGHLLKAREALKSFPSGKYRDYLHELSFYIQKRDS